MRSWPHAATPSVVDRAVVGGHEQHEVRGARVQLVGEHVLGPGANSDPGSSNPPLERRDANVAAEHRRRRGRTRRRRRGRVVGGGSRSRRSERASGSSTSGRTTSWTGNAVNVSTLWNPDRRVPVQMTSVTAESATRGDAPSVTSGGWTPSILWIVLPPLLPPTATRRRAGDPKSSRRGRGRVCVESAPGTRRGPSPAPSPRRRPRRRGVRPGSSRRGRAAGRRARAAAHCSCDRGGRRRGRAPVRR